MSVPDRAGSVVAVGGSWPRMPAQAGGRDVGRDDRSVGEEAVGEGRQRLGSGRPAGDDQPPAARDPASQRLTLRSRQSLGVDVLPDDPVDRSPGLQPFGQVVRGQGHDGRSDLVLVRQQVEVADEPLGMLGDDRDDELAGVVGA